MQVTVGEKIRKKLLRKESRLKLIGAPVVLASLFKKGKIILLNLAGNSHKNIGVTKKHRHAFSNFCELFLAVSTSYNN